MKKATLFLLLSFIAVKTVFPQQIISEETALYVANMCILSKAPDDLTKNNLIFSELNISYTEKAGNIPIFYIVNIKPQGFVIVSARKSYYPIIAYSWNTHFEFPITSPAVQMWLDDITFKIISSSSLPELKKFVQPQWDFYENNDIFFMLSQKTKVVLPMLTSQWNQGIYYNEFCPKDNAGPDDHTYAGCVATAIGQVMNYFRYPLTGTGSYTSEFLDYGIHSVDYSQANYNWNEMPLKLTRSNHPVAELLYHIGVSVDMNYGPDGSGMWNHKAAHTMSTFFGYTDSTQYNFRDTTTIDWNGMLIEHLDRNIPLYYAGWTDSMYVSGHAFVCDGYQDSVFFHFNWGWGGSWDGYFHIDNLIVGGSDFTTMHEAVINGTPKENYPYYCNGTDTLQTLDGTIEDGSGPLYDYQNDTYCSWLIAPDDTVEFITLNFVKFDTQPGDVVRVYDGIDDSAPLLGTYSGSTIPSEITSTGNKMFVIFESNSSDISSGFLASYKAQLVKTCVSLTSLTATAGTITDGSEQYNYQNGNICRWRIEPPGAELINITFSEFDVDSTDYVRVTDITNNVTVGEYKGTQLPPQLSIWTDKVMITFLTGSTATAGGFSLNYESFLQSTEEFFSEHITVYPNPASDFLIISFENGIALKQLFITLYSVTGQAIESFNVSSNTHEVGIPVKHIPDGFYIINIHGENGQQTSRKVHILHE